MKKIILVFIVLAGITVIFLFGNYTIVQTDGMSLPCTEIGRYDSDLDGYVTSDGDIMYKFDSNNNYSIYRVSNGIATPYDDEDDEFRKYDLYCVDGVLYQGDVYDFETKIEHITMRIRLQNLFDRANSQVPDFPSLAEYTDNATNTLERIGSFFSWFGNAFMYIFRFIGWIAGRFVYIFKLAKIVIEGLGVTWNF